MPKSNPRFTLGKLRIAGWRELDSSQASRLSKRAADRAPALPSHYSKTTQTGESSGYCRPVAESFPEWASHFRMTRFADS